MSFWDWPYGEGWEPLSFIDQEIVAPLYYLLCVECGGGFSSQDPLAEKCDRCRERE